MRGLAEVGADHQPPQVEAVGEAAGQRPEQARRRPGDQQRRDRGAGAAGLLDVERQHRQRRAGAGVGEGQRRPEGAELGAGAQQRERAPHQMITWTVPPSTDQAAPAT